MSTLSDSDAPPELFGKADSLGAGSEDGESSAEERGGGRSGDEDDGDGEEEDEEVEVEEKEEAKEREENDKDDEVEEEVVEEEEAEEGADLSGKDAEDTGDKIESEEHVEGLKSVISTPERSNSNPVIITHAGVGSGGNLTAYDPSDDTNNEAQLEKEASTKSSKDVKRTHGDPMDGEHTISLQVHENELATKNKSVKSDGAVEENAPLLHTRTNFQTPEEFSLSCTRTPQRRPRSSSPCAPLENTNKRPAVTCDFFASGWCIKGNLCKFLHLKDGVTNTSQRTKEDLAGPMMKADSLDDSGSRDEAERSKLSASQELLDSSNIQRSLVRSYGGESHGLPQFNDNYNMHGAPKAGREFLRVSAPQGGHASNPPMNSLVQEEYKKPFRLNTHFDSVHERQIARDDFLSTEYLNEGKLHQEMARGESLNDLPFTRGSPLTRNTLFSEYKYSGGSSTTSGLYHYSNNPHAHDKMTDDLSVRKQQSQFPHALAQAGTSSTLGLTSSSAEHLDTRKTLYFDRGNYGSRFSSLTGSSSPYYSRSEAENTAQRNFSKDLPAPFGQKTQVRDAWETSVPFRSSFCLPPANIPSPGSQYDPLLDSIERPTAGNITFQTSQMTIINNASSPQRNADPILVESCTQAEKPFNSFAQPHESILDKNTSARGLSGYTAVAATLGPITVVGGNSSMPNGEKHRIHGRVVDGVTVTEADPGANLKNQEGKGRNNKESKAMKFFHSALVDFVKELVKPSWREGHLSKDAHKLIVKKAVEKVLGAIQPHQVPSTTELLNQYLSNSRPKLLKLVEGYVGKYAKS